MHTGKSLIQTAILLNRSPVLTRPPTSFEAALYQYNSNIGRALFNPFPYDFYFKSGSLLKRQFNKEERVREKQAYNWGKNIPKKSRSSVSKARTPPTNAKTAAPTSTGPTLEDDKETMSRTTEADRVNDVKSLNRKGHRNLYLLIKRGSHHWRLPGAQGGLKQNEKLHEAAERELREECGVNMDAWIVGRHPIAFMNAPPSQVSDSNQFNESKIFFFKAHILAGQIDTTITNLQDFAWLTREEIKTAVTSEYWSSIRDVLSEY